MLALQVRLVLEEEETEYDQRDYEEPEEPVADGRLSESVDRTDDAAAGKESSEDGEPECGEDQPHVPHLQHAALFLHHHRVQEGGAGEPRHERCVLDGVPSPVAAPAEDGIRPVGAKKVSAG